MSKSQSAKGASPAATNRFERYPRLTLSVSLLGSLGIALLGAEMIARWVHPLAPSWEFRIPDPRFGWVLTPGASFTNRLAEESVPVSYNAEGWRDRPHAKDKAEGVVRVLMLGDSFMEAYSVRFEDSLPARLERLTSTADRRIEVINFGVSGYGTLQEYLVFNAFGQAYQPNVVILAIHLSNDLNDNSQELSPHDLRPFLDPEVSEPGWRITRVDYETALQRYEEQMRPLNRLLRDSALLQLGRRALKRVSQWMWQETPPSVIPTEFQKYYCSQPPEYDRAWEVTRRILTRLNREVHAAGARLLVMSVPAIMEVDEDVMANHMRKAANRKPKSTGQDALQADKLCLQNPPAYARLGKLLVELDIDYLDLLPAFRQARRQTGVELFRRGRDTHWNPQGHALAARELAAALERRAYLVSHGADLGGVGLHCYSCDGRDR